MFSKFEEAVHFVSTNKNFDVTDEERLMIYAFFKMATVGQPPEACKCSKLDIKNTMKYNAWKEFASNYDCRDAQGLYVTLVNQLIKKYNF